MKHEIKISCLDDLGRAAREFLKEIGDSRIVALFAPMGAGKTTFTTALCKELGVEEDAVSSPTFAIVNEYRTGTGEPMYHFDFYRIEKIAEAHRKAFRSPRYRLLRLYRQWMPLHYGVAGEYRGDPSGRDPAGAYNGES